MKKMILVASPPASGKTYIAKALAKNLQHVVYLDKDTLIVLSKQIFAVAEEEYNRSSAFFKENIRNYEYDAILNLAFEALQYEDNILLNAPFTREIRSFTYLSSLSEKLNMQNTTLYVIWVITNPHVVYSRMLKRNSDRDTWKLHHWDEYQKSVDFSIPATITCPHSPYRQLLFHNSNDAEFEISMKQLLPVLEE